MIYALSLSTVISEVNSSAVRAEEAFIRELASEACPTDEDDCLAREAAEAAIAAIEPFEELIGTYRIPSQTTIDTIVNEMYEDDGSPSPGLDKIARDTDGDGFLDKAVIIIAVDETKTAKEVIEKTQKILDNISKEERPCEFDQNGNASGGCL